MARAAAADIFPPMKALAARAAGPVKNEVEAWNSKQKVCQDRDWMGLFATFYKFPLTYSVVYGIMCS